MGLRDLALIAALAAGCLDVHPSGGHTCGPTAPNVTLRAVDAASGRALPFAVTVDCATPGGDCIGLDGAAVPAGPCVGDLHFSLVGAGLVGVSSDGYAPATLRLDGGRAGEGQCAAPTYSFALWVPLTAE